MNIPLNWAVAWLAAVSLTAFLMTAWDKSRAKRRQWRVPESTLWLVAVLGGATVMYLAMLMTNHKTLHRRFMVGLPLLMVAQIAAVYLLWHTKCWGFI